MFLLEGSNKWTPRKRGILPTEVGNPMKVTYNPVTTHLHIVSKSEKKITSKTKMKGEREYLIFKLSHQLCTPHNPRKGVQLFFHLQRPSRNLTTWMSADPSPCLEEKRSSDPRVFIKLSTVAELNWKQLAHTGIS